MDSVVALVIGVMTIASVFAFTNGFHDAANSIATSIATRALSPAVALTMAAVLNFIGALLGTGVAETIGSGIIAPPPGAEGLVIVLAGLLAAIAWNMITWWFGLPSSSSHALIGGLCGAGLAAAITVEWGTINTQVLIPMLLSPILGFVLAFAAMKLVLRLFEQVHYQTAMRGFRSAQTVSAAVMALGHGLQDAQKTMGVMVLALVAGGYHSGSEIPLGVKLLAAAAISLGTAVGGHRIIKTLGHRVVEIDPARGFVAETVASSIMYTTAYAFHAPISTTHAITAAIMGTGATKRRSAIRWVTVRKILTAWVLTLPAAALLGAALYWLFSIFL